MKKIISLLIALILMSPAMATVNSNTVPGTALEESVLSIKGKKMNSGSNPFTVTLKTADGQSIDLPTAVKNKGNKADVLLPTIPDSVSGLVQVVLEISGGNVDAASPETFALILTSRPDGVAAESSTVGTPPVLASTTDSGLSTEGPQGPQGDQGETGESGNEGPQGPQGPTPTTFPGGGIIGAVNLAKQITEASQNAITTLNNLVMIGTTGVTTTAKGPLAAPEGFIGDLLGNVNGNVLGSSSTFTGSLAGEVTGTMAATAIANSVVTGKQLNGGYSSSAGLVANGDSLQTAISKLDGNIKSNDTDIATNVSGIAANKAILDNATTLNTPNTLVLRDANGDFSADSITADTEFLGNLNGTVLTSVQNSIATMNGLTSVGTTAINTTFNGPIVASEGITAPVTGDVSGDLTGQVITASQTNITALPALVNAGTTLVNTTFAGPIIANEQVFGSLNGQVLTAVQTEITDLPNLVFAGNTGSTPVTFRGKIQVDNTLTASNTVTAPLFSGPLSGNASSATIANTVSEPQQNAITSLLNLVDIGKASATTTMSGPVAALKGITGTLTGDVNGNLNGSAAEAIRLVNGTTSLDITGGDAALFTTNGDVDLVLPSVNGELALVADLEAAAAALQAQIGANANGAAANAAAITSVNGKLATVNGNVTTNATNIGLNSTAIGTNTSNIAALTTAGGKLNGTALSALALTDSTMAAAVTVNGTNAVTIQTNGDVTLELPATSGTLALVGAPSLPAVGASTFDVDVVAGAVTSPVAGEAEINVTGLDFIKVSSAGGANDLVGFTGGVEGQVLTVYFTNAVDVLPDAITSATFPIQPAGGSIINANADDVLVVVFTGGTWYQVSYSDN